MTEVRRHRASILKQAPSCPMTKSGPLIGSCHTQLETLSSLTLTWLWVINLGVSGVWPIACKLTHIGPKSQLCRRYPMLHFYQPQHWTATLPVSLQLRTVHDITHAKFCLPVCWLWKKMCVGWSVCLQGGEGDESQGGPDQGNKPVRQNYYRGFRPRFRPRFACWLHWRRAATIGE